MLRLSMVCAVVLLLPITLTSLADGPDRPAPADTVIYGKVFTADAAGTRAEAVAVRGNRIVAVGTRSDVATLAGPKTRVIEAGSSSVVPGFNDAHCHFTVGFGIEYDVDVSDAASVAEIQEALRRFVAANPDTRAIQGMGWDLADIPGEEYPTAKMLDAVVDDRPVLMYSEGPHGLWVNSKAMEYAGVTKERKDPPKTIIIRDGDGNPTGMFLGRGLLGMFRGVMPFPDVGGIHKGIEAGFVEASRLGVTSVQEPVSGFLIGALARLHESGKQTVRFRIWGQMPHRFGGGVEQHAQQRKNLERPGWIEFGALKGGVDGMPGLRTSALIEPYSDAAGSRGLMSEGPEEVEPGVLATNEAGVAVALHATGDAAVRVAVDAFAKARGAGTSCRNRIEHGFFIAPEEVPRFREHDIVVSTQPSFLAIDLAKTRFYERRLGKERVTLAYPLRSLLDAGAVVAFGTDFSLTPLNPMVGLYAAVTRQDVNGEPEGGWVPAERISLAEAVRAYTYGSAYAEGAEKDKGTLAVGKLADIVILDRDIFAIEPQQLLEVKVTHTIVDGRVVHESASIEKR